MFLSLGLVWPAMAQSKPSVELRAEPSFFSPNHDDAQDQIFFYPVLDRPFEISKWQLDIQRHANGKRVRRLSGGALPALLKWDGTDKNGAIVADGAYDARLTASGGGAKVNSATSFGVDTAPPDIRLQVATQTFHDAAIPEDYDINFFPTIVDQSPIAQWQIQILDPVGRTVTVMDSSAPVHAVSWDGIDKSKGFYCPSGSYEAAMTAWDQAGNQSQTIFVQFQLQAAPRDVMVKSFKFIQPTKYTTGVAVRMNFDDFFADSKQTGLSLIGQKKMHELAQLINAHPEARVYVSGYTKSGAANSLSAWIVYNHLVKEERIPSARFIVQETPSGRRSTFKNGVEVMLEGGSL
jgi:flagellar hook assembly protein FlgD